jgi:uncharacterized protein (TIGR04255 family)
MGVAVSAKFGELDETPLGRSPIVMVVWQVRFESHPALVAPHAALKIQESLGGPGKFSLNELPKIQVSVQATAPIAEGAPSSSAGTAGGGWRLSAQDGSWHVSIQESGISVETARYGTWDKDFTPRLQQVLDALEVVEPPVVESRLGLRYINIVVGNAVGKQPLSAPSELSELLSPWLLGPLLDPRLGQSVQLTQGRTVLVFEDASVVLNHGVVTTETGELGYLIDIDAYREGGRAFRSADVISQSAALHRTALGVFQASLTSQALTAMRESSPGTEGG